MLIDMRKILLILIFSLGFILRFWQLGQNPASLDWDEASLGYNAYSILQTGRDEYGSFLPLSIRSFGDYKPSLYVYLTIIPVKIFGLNEFSTRFISALLGSLSVIVVYLLVKELFPKKSSSFYVLCSLFFALSPWHIQFSRIAFEANSALFFSLCGLWLFFKGLKKELYFLPSFFSFVLSAYTYHSPRLVVPLLIIGLVFLYRSEIRQKFKGFVIGLLLFIILFIPIIQQLRSTSARFGSVTVLNADEKLGSSIKAIEWDKNNNDFLGAFSHNRRIIFAREVIGGYLDHFNFDFLFLTGDPPGRHHAVGMGMLYIWDLPFVLMGLFGILGGLQKKENILMVWWFLVAPVASSLTSGTPHAVRSLMYLPTYQIFIAAGIVEFLNQLQANRSRKKLIYLVVFSLFLINFFYYLHMYWIHTPVEYASEWQYGYKQAVEEVKNYEADYDKIVVTYAYDQPYIFFLFYNQTDPSWYQANWGSGEIQRANRSYGKYEFRKIDWGKDDKLSRTLFVGTPKEIPDGIPGQIKDINYPAGTVAFRIVGR